MTLNKAKVVPWWFTTV